MSAPPAVEVRELRVIRRGRPVLASVSLDVAAGVVTGLLGPSGAGKSTLMRAIVGVQRIHGGAVRVLGAPAGASEQRRQVGYVTQAPAVYLDLSVEQNLAYFASVLGAPATDVDRVMAMVDLAPHRRTRVDRLSGGEQARVSLAASLLGEPRLLVLDEPTVGLDPLLRRDLWAIFRDLASRGVTLLVSSHVMDEAQECDELLLMRDGAIIAADSPSALLARTGTTNMRDAFLRLIQAGQGGAQ